MMFILGSFLKRVVDFLLVLIELFLLVAIAEALRANIDWKSTFLPQQGLVDSKFQVEGVAPTNHSSCHKTRVKAVSCGLSFCHKSRVWHMDRQTDVQPAFSCVTRPPCIQCSAVKRVNFLLRHSVYNVYSFSFP